MNSATDNPMVFSDTGKILSGGNFHGEFPSKALDYLAIGIHELASISEVRIVSFETVLRILVGMQFTDCPFVFRLFLPLCFA
jgi:hypothetical protein